MRSCISAQCDRTAQERGGRPNLAVSVHLDTVFPEGTEVTVKEKDGIVLAPGIGDDSRGHAALLTILVLTGLDGRHQAGVGCEAGAR